MDTPDDAPKSDYQAWRNRDVLITRMLQGVMVSVVPLTTATDLITVISVLLQKLMITKQQYCHTLQYSGYSA